MQPHPLTHLRHTRPSRYTSRGPLVRLLIVALIFTLLTSCNVGADDSTSSATPPIDGTAPLLPRPTHHTSPSNPTPTAPPIAGMQWPPGSHLRGVGGITQVVVADGTLVASVGDSLEMGGSVDPAPGEPTPEHDRPCLQVPNVFRMQSMQVLDRTLPPEQPRAELPTHPISMRDTGAPLTRTGEPNFYGDCLMHWITVQEGDLQRNNIQPVLWSPGYHLRERDGLASLANSGGDIVTPTRPRRHHLLPQRPRLVRRQHHRPHPRRVNR